MAVKYLHAVHVNYVILTPEQFRNDYPAMEPIPVEGPVIVVTDDDGSIWLIIEANNKAMLAELFGDIAEYAKVEADPGAIEPNVGANTVEVPK